MKVIAMGYTGTGSSALVHLLKEYSNCYDVDTKNYEHNVLYVPHGIFDLEDVLLNNNSLYRSDAALNDFYNEMKNLNDNDYNWFGGFQKRFGDEFMEAVTDFIDSLIIYSRDGGWSYDYRYRFKLVNVVKDIIKKLLGKEVDKFGYRIDTNGKDNLVKHALPTDEEFYTAANKLIDAYFKMVGYSEDKVYVFDQIIEPWQLDRIHNYFDEDTRFIVFDRDPRDTFLSQKYVWSRTGNYSIMPTDVNLFIDFYSRLYRAEKYSDDNRILRIQFEDLIYRYDETVKIIENFIGAEKLGDHKLKKKFFIPEQSIKNTQLFTVNPKWRVEAEAIENSELVNHIYDFPYESVTRIDDITDPNPDTSIKE